MDIKDVARMGGKAAWANKSPEERSKEMSARQLKRWERIKARAAKCKKEA